MSWINRLVVSAESILDNTYDQIRNEGDFFIQPYRWYGTEEVVTIKGRILRPNGLRPPEESDSKVRNLLNAYRMLNSDEVGGVELVASFGDDEVEIISDEEGYFSAELANTAQTGWLNVKVTSIEDPTIFTDCPTYVPSPNAKFATISDIDDTIIQTYATDLRKFVNVTFFQNATGRAIFPLATDLYHELARPLFFVSSSPWNLYNLLRDIMLLNDIPRAPLCLRDIGIDESKLFTSSHGVHKTKQITTIFNTYPHLKFILIGDSGQHDPEIYSELAHEHPHQILAILIRHVHTPQRKEEVQDILSTIAHPTFLSTDPQALLAFAKNIKNSQQTNKAEKNDG